MKQALETRRYELIWRRDQSEVVFHAYITEHVLTSTLPV